MKPMVWPRLVWPRVGWQRAACLSLLLSLASPATAQDDVDIDVRGALGLWSRDFNLPRDPGVVAASVKLAMHWSPSEDLSARAELFGYATFGNKRERQRAELRTALLVQQGDHHVLRIGRQIDVWGKADRLNPTDNLSPRDFRILSSDDDDQRLGLAMVRADLVLSDRLRLKSYWVPEFRPTNLIFPLSPQIVIDRRGHDFSQIAVKLDHIGGALDWSLSWYEGRDRIYDLALEGGGVAQRYNNIRVIGADLAGAAGPWGYRAEAAWTDTRYDPLRNPLVRRPEFWAVIGLDRNFGSGLYANVQGSFRRVFKMDDMVSAPAAPLRPQIDILRFQQDRAQFGVTANLRYSWDDQRWAADAVALHYIERGQGLARFELRHQLTPRLGLQGRAQKFFGPKNSYFGRIAPASAVSIQARAAF